MTILVVAVSLLAAPTAAQCTIANVTVSGGVTDPDTGAPARRVTAASPGKKSQREFFVARGAVIERVALNASQGTTVFSAPTRPDAALRYDFGSPITGLHHVHATDELVVVAQRRVWAVPRGDPSSGPRAVGGEVARIVGSTVTSIGTRLQVGNGSCVIEADLALANPVWTRFAGRCDRTGTTVVGGPILDAVLSTNVSALSWAMQDSVLAIANGDELVIANPVSGLMDVIPVSAMALSVSTITLWTGVAFSLQYFRQSTCDVFYGTVSGTSSVASSDLLVRRRALSGSESLCRDPNVRVIASNRREAVATAALNFSALVVLADSASNSTAVQAFDYLGCDPAGSDAAPSADSEGANTATIVGATIGSVVGVSVLVVVSVLLIRRHHAVRLHEAEEPPASLVPTEADDPPIVSFVHDPAVDLDASAKTVPKSVRGGASTTSDPSASATQCSVSAAADRASAIKRQLREASSSVGPNVLSSGSLSATLSGDAPGSATQHLTALSRGDFLAAAGDLGADKARVLRLRAWSDAEMLRHNRRCEFVAAGEWTKGKVLGRGANGVVFAVVLPDGSTVAMKEVALGGSAADVDAALREVMHEVELLSRMHHDNLVTYYGIVVDREQHVVRLFMENVTGGSLASMVRDMQEPLPEGTAQRFVRQMLRGLAFIHENGVIHRDLKCDNVLRDATTGAVKLADFGTAKAVGNAAGASRAAQTMIGTPYFMAPEILAAGTVEDAEAGYGAKADIWSVGITVAELLDKGHPPWPSFPTPAHAFLHIANPASRPVLREHLSGHARDFIEACTLRDPRERPSALELLEHAWMQTILDDDEEELEYAATSGTSECGRRSTSVVKDRTPLPGAV